ncbi:MAG: Dna2/Cas4 domain-containing protein [Anaerolineaceae bacterium]|nr:Dna2/Cas4 domain-containing protein [Anaerolineaceae bacterium]NTV35390.1 Dna2/Cas4 domain-containing protein [Anaerolineaceae bacterium]
MRTIRASEIGTYLYCKRAWWYHSQGIESQNQTEMAEGSAYHRNHGRQVLTAMFLRAAAWIMLLAAVILLAIGITRWLTG